MKTGLQRVTTVLQVMGATAIVAVALLTLAPRVRTETQTAKYPPAFPRRGATEVPVRTGEFPRGDIDVWEVLHQKGEPSPMYELPMDVVSVTLTEGAVKYTRPDKTSRIEYNRFGEVRFESKGTIMQDEGMDELASRSVVFQIKNGQHAHLAPKVDGVPGQFPRIDAKKLFETETFNVWEELWLPDRPITKHLHYNQASYVMLNGGVLNGGNGDGKNTTEPPSIAASHWRTGYVLSMGAVKTPHEEAWVAGNPRAVWVELK